jgi:hypothetical protein
MPPRSAPGRGTGPRGGPPRGRGRGSGAARESTRVDSPSIAGEFLYSLVIDTLNHKLFFTI